MGGDRFIEAEVQKKILVVGGGPAGCEAARVAAERGHIVTLVEASGQLGGQFRLAGMQPRRGQILDYIDWFERQLNKLGVDTRLNTPSSQKMSLNSGRMLLFLQPDPCPQRLDTNVVSRRVMYCPV